ncbi:dolichol kinase-like protein [Natrinema pellirubrum DSM 15624]|uniref:Dolichol kinase n=1 Tax=Natrinema pellirubrum (strain DSM 15624 / CIP 106293 / JCM 10476 / NCIMB 786 / 157) TaxID=797303 RepID=L0JPX3_NATP1|nr:dolichol kinase [Natrinema pellirubrum]AGB33580.1 dolichol kinase [Natrinema pellirubrum DSM 15624]ELY70566.1 dolichol kinase-like protein [Natrinema pellirubrum DSM 15624]
MADELKRRLVHASGSGLVALWLLADALDAGLTWTGFRLLMVVLATGALVLEFLRLRVGLDWRLYDVLTREYEQDNPAAYALYLISMAAVVVVFEPDIALPAMLMLALGDPISGAVSDNTLQRVKPPKVLGTMFLVSTLIAIPFLPITAALIAAVGATLADGVTLEVRTYIVDDNLTIPIYAACLAWAALEFAPL